MSLRAEISNIDIIFVFLFSFNEIFSLQNICLLEGESEETRAFQAADSLPQFLHKWRLGCTEWGPEALVCVFYTSGDDSIPESLITTPAKASSGSWKQKLNRNHRNISNVSNNRLKMQLTSDIRCFVHNAF